MSRKRVALWVSLGCLLASIWLIQSARAETVVVLESPSWSYGPHSWGRWQRVEASAYAPGEGCAGNGFLGAYQPTTGTNAYWWTPGYNDAAAPWTGNGKVVDWDRAWEVSGYLPIPEIGKYVWTAGGAVKLKIDLHRIWFSVNVPAGKQIGGAVLQVFADNLTRFYINGAPVLDHDGGARAIGISPSLLVAGSNLLAIGNHADNCLPSGIQYRVSVTFEPLPTPTKTTTPTLPLTATATRTLRRTLPPVQTATRTPTHTATRTPTTTAAHTPTRTPTATHTGTRTPTRTATRTPTQTPAPRTATPTWTRTATGTSTSTLAPSPLLIAISARYPGLVYYAPNVGEPAQVLEGTITGGAQPYALTIFVRAPSAVTRTYSWTSNGVFQLDAGVAGNPYFGVEEQGTWTAWATATDAHGLAATSPAVSWTVSWWPVHGLP